MSDPTAYFKSMREDEPRGGHEMIEPIWVNFNSGVEPFEVLPGLEFRPIVGSGLAVNMVRLKPNTVEPVHAHSEEQVSLVLEGEFEFEVDGDARTLVPGMAVIIPPNMPHGARTFGTECVEIDIFHPPRQGLLDAMKARQSEDRNAGGNS